MSATVEQPRVIRTPKSYWVNKRVHSHRDWKFAFWRELFQNSVDAKARNIDITISEETGKGSWGRPPNDANVVRVRFQDDGTGMTRDVLENVFFAPGESTKRNSDDSVGGFGTARTMLCFSQSRYSIETGIYRVEGDGSEYTIEEGPKVKGTTFEIDLSELETTLGGMRDALERYLSMSQLNVNITLNGKSIEAKAKKGPARRQLVAEVTEKAADGTRVRVIRPFATVHANQGEKSPHRGKVIVRVNGAAMFVEKSGLPHQVVVEIDRDLSREVLTDNRDGMKWDYQNALNTFMEEIAQDQTSALKEKESRKHRVIAGGLGSHLVESNLKVPLSAVDYTPSSLVIEREAGMVPVSALRNFQPAEFEEKGFVGVPAFALRELLTRLREGRPTFLDTWHDQNEVHAFREAARGDLAASLNRISEDFGRFLAAGVGASLRGAGLDPKYVDMHDIHIYIEDEDTKEMTAEEKEERTRWTWAVYRWSPDYWKKKGQSSGDGRGKSANLMLAAWTTMCEHAVRSLMEVYPEINQGKGIRFATGFAFVRDKKEYNYDLGRTVPKGTGALHTQKDDVEVLLINPIRSDGKEAYDLRTEGGKFGEKKGLSDLAALAVHEVAHILRSRHDEEYASILTRIIAAFYHPDRQKAMRADLVRNMAAVSAAYGGGISQVQALDPASVDMKDIVGRRGRPRKARPAEKLQAIAQPTTTAVLGTVADPTNAEAANNEVPALLLHIEETIRREKLDGVRTVNCDAAAELENRLAASLVGNDFTFAQKNDIETPEITNAREATNIGPKLSDLNMETLPENATVVQDAKTEVPGAKTLISELSIGRFNNVRDVRNSTPEPKNPNNPVSAIAALKQSKNLSAIVARIKAARLETKSETPSEKTVAPTSVMDVIEPEFDIGSP